MRHMAKWWRGGLGAAVLAACLQVGVAQQQQLQAQPLEIVITADGIQVPEGVEAGFYTLEVTDQREGAAEAPPPDVSVDRLKEGATLEQAVAGYEALNAAFAGGGGNPGEAVQDLTQLLVAVTGSSMPPAVFELVPGEYMASITGELFEYAGFTVSAASEQTQAPPADLTVDMTEFAFSIPDEVPGGEQTWEVRNVGEQVHHLILMRIKEGMTLDDVMAFLETEEGEPPVEEVGYTAVLSPEVSNYLTFVLQPGNYFAICFMPDYETGQPHYLLGMTDAFTVVGD